LPAADLLNFRKGGGTVAQTGRVKPAQPAARRILVAGVSGIGKSTLCREIARRTGLPYTELDSLHHGPGWVKRDDFESDVARIAASDEWVSEWQYRQVRPVLEQRAELLVWLDLPTRVTMSRVIQRTIKRSITREELWNGNREPALWRALASRDSIVRWAWQTRNKWRPVIPTLTLPVVHLTSRKAVDEWLAQLPR